LPETPKEVLEEYGMEELVAQYTTDEDAEKLILWSYQNLKNKNEKLEMHERNLEGALREIIRLVSEHDQELSYDCVKIIDKWSQS
jgi:hypothetical protein